MWELPDAQSRLVEMYQQALNASGNQSQYALSFMPGVDFYSSDTAASCASLDPVFFKGGIPIRFVEGVHIKHLRRGDARDKEGVDLFAEGAQKFTGNGVGGPLMFVVEMVVWVLVILAAIALVQAVRRVPVQYAKRVIGNKQYGGVRQYIPLKINAAGVMPIIFAQALMMFPMLLGRYDATRGIAAAFSSYTSVWYNIVFGLLVIIFTYFYTAVTVNPTMMAEDMKKNGGFIPGVKPGKKTAEYLDSIMTKVTLPGSIFLAIIACMPAFAGLLNVQPEFAQFFGGTSLLILVGVVLDTLQQIESHLLMRHYDGLLSSGRIHGRSGVSAY